VTDSCAGACCAVFPMHKDQPLFTNKGPLPRDSAFILDMLIPLTRRQGVARSRRLGYPDPPKYGPNYGLYTCRHWDEQTRLCTAYDQRPRMCSDYPYTGRSCERGCGYVLPPAENDRIAAQDDSTWVWDEDAKGWRPRSNSGFLWDAENGVLRKPPPASAETR
jgi:Fe-S-cluster containining protein